MSLIWLKFLVESEIHEDKKNISLPAQHLIFKQIVNFINTERTAYQDSGVHFSTE